MLNRPIVFDSFALLALFHKERRWKKVRDALNIFCRWRIGQRSSRDQVWVSCGLCRCLLYCFNQKISGCVFTGDPEFRSVKDIVDIEWLW